MRVFITGGAGWIGTATVLDLVAHGHQVLALARSDSTATSLEKMGAEVIRGDLENLDVLKSGAGSSDAVIHLAFVNDFNKFEHGCLVERAAINAMADAMANSNKALVTTSGTLAVMDVTGARNGETATEDTAPLRDVPPFNERVKSEDLIVELATKKGIRGMVMRMCPVVHGKGDERFITIFGAIAQKHGKAVYVGNGQTKWPAVHRTDAAAALRLAVERGRPGGIYHAVAEQGVSTKDIMETIAKKVGVSVESVGPEVAVQTMGMLGKLIAVDDATSSEKTRTELGWEPKDITLLEDIEQNYF